LVVNVFSRTDRTLPALEYGGGVEITASPRQFFRFDVGERVLRYPGPGWDRAGALREGPFWGQALRLSGGFGFFF
jgi:hypothetical protein